MARLVLGTNINNTGTASLVRDVSPAIYRAYEVDETGKIVNSKSEPFHPLPSNATDIGPCCYYQAYKNAPVNILNGNIDLGLLESITGSSACYGMFSGDTGIVSVDLGSLKRLGTNQVGGNFCSYMFEKCNNITDIDLNSLLIIDGSQACMYMFSECTGLTNIDLSSLIGIVGSQTCNYTFQKCTNITSVDLSNLTNIYGSSACCYMFMNCSSLESVNLSHLTAFKSASTCLENTFLNCTSLKTLYFPKLLYSTTNYDSIFRNMLKGCSDVTVHFPAEWQETMSTWTNVKSGFGGTNTTILWDLPNTTTLDLNHAKDAIENGITVFTSFASNNYFPNITSFDISTIETVKGLQFSYLFNNSPSLVSINLSGLKNIIDSSNRSNTGIFYSAFKTCTNLTNIDLSSLENISGDYSCYQMFQDCTGLTSIDLSSLISISGSNAFSSAFANCTSLKTVNLSSLKNIESQACQSIFKNCTSLESVDLSSLSIINGRYSCQCMFQGCTSLESMNFSSLEEANGEYCCYQMFSGCTNLKELRFPSLKKVVSGAFASLLNGCSDVTVHFPSNLPSVSGMSGTRTTVLYDLPPVE